MWEIQRNSRGIDPQMTSNYIKLLQEVDNKKVDCDVYVISLRGKINGT